MPIITLPPQLANQIAAGEVVERPASVVKELVENSLDAGADQIDIEIERGGHKRIRIRDNGGGIEKHELALALSPHATSKIATLSDLEAIASLGFRGEALASISSVSRLVLTSKTQAQSEAWGATAQGRDMEVKLEPAAHPNGTTIDVADLFYNTPARRKFLRAEKTEFQHIEEVVKRIALSRPQVGFSLKHNGKISKRFPRPKADASITRIAQVCGKSFAEKARSVDIEYDGITVRAWMGGRDLMRSSTDLQFSFVNGRAMRDKLLLHAIRQAYETVFAEFEQPAYVLFIDLSPSDVDVNVHPAKHEVRFQQARQVHDLICKAAQDALVDNGHEAHGEAGHDEPATHTTPSFYAPSDHDYIRPLTQAKPVSHSSTPTFRPSHSGVTNHSSGQVRETVVSPTMSAAYQTLMTAPTGSEYAVLSPFGVWRQLETQLVWLSVSSLWPAWLIAELERITVKQPLLMPVSIPAPAQDAQDFVSFLNGANFTLHAIAHKIMLKEVPAGLRGLPWVRIFSQVAQQNVTDIAGLAKVVQTVIDADASQYEQLNQQVISWFLQLDEAHQSQLEQEFGKRKSMHDFTTWMAND